MTRYYHMGKQFDPDRDAKGRYARSLWEREKEKCRSVYREAKLWTKYFIAPLAAIVLIGSITTSFGKNEISVQKAFADTNPLTSKIEALQDEVLTALAQCESGNIPKDAALIHFDNNKAGTLPKADIPSLGAYQMKVSFVKDYEYRRSKTLLTNYEATLLALDTPRAKELARYAIFETQGGIFRWTCGAPLAEKVSIIKSLMN